MKPISLHYYPMKMSQIAKLAGVSTTTVSRTFHSPNLVRPEIRNRIIKIAKENNYLYHALAADLSRRRSNILGILIPTANKSVFGTTLMAIQEKAQDNYFSIIIGNTLYDEDLESRLVTQFQERRVAGVIFTGFVLGQEKLIRSLMDNNIPCVIIWEKLEDKDISYVGFDNFKAAYSATDYLIRLRHRCIGLIIGPYDKVGRVQKRFIGYKSALEDHGLSFNDDLVVAASEPDLPEGKRAMKQLLSLPDRPTAVFAASDRLAIGAMAAVKEEGYRVPEDISIVGFDDIDVSAYCDPPLTTVRVPAHEIGTLAVSILMDSIEKGTSEVQQYLLDAELVLRQSCADLR
jgi:DNA-binding LacI/PurR family transcriptional regulator